MDGANTDEHRSGAAGAWRQAFLRMPYWRDPAVGMGVIMDTFETAVTWDRFPDFYANVNADVAHTIERVTGQEAWISCRLTHVYPDGPAPYFTFVARPADGSVASALAAWRDIKLAANAAIIDHGGTMPWGVTTAMPTNAKWIPCSGPCWRQPSTALTRTAF